MCMLIFVKIDLWRLDDILAAGIHHWTVSMDFTPNS